MNTTTATETAIASIAGAKTHIVSTWILTEDQIEQVAAGWKFSGGRNVQKFREVTIPAGTRVYGGPHCGTVRTNGRRYWGNNISLAETVTCAKCAKIA